MKTKTIRNVTVFLAIIAFAFMLVTTWFHIDLGDWDKVAEPAAAVLIALGILVETGKEPEAITGKSILKKLKSPVMWGAMIVLLQFISARLSGAAVDIMGQITDTIKLGIVLLGIINNPKNRVALI